MSTTSLAKDALRIVSTAGLSKDVIDLLNLKITLLDEQVTTLTQEILALKGKNFDLLRELEELKKQQGDLSPFPDGFDDTTNTIVIAMFGERGVSIEEISQKLRVDFGIMEYHFDLLIKEKFLEQTKPGIIMYGERSPAEFRLTPEGRSYAVKIKKS
jgi:hypothetical protein